MLLSTPVFACVSNTGTGNIQSITATFKPEHSVVIANKLRD